MRARLFSQGMTINRKIVLAITVTLALLIGSSAWFNLRDYKLHYTDALLKGSFGIGFGIRSMVREMLDLGLPLASLDGMNVHLQDVTRNNRHIAYIGIGDMHGRVIFHSNSTLIGQQFHDPTMQTSMQATKPLWQLYERFDGHSYYDITIPIFDAGHQHRGFIRLGFLTSIVDDELHAATIRIAINALLTFLLVAFILDQLLNRLVILPVTQLSRQAQRMSSGDFDSIHDLHTERNDEIGQLSLALENMANRIQQQIFELTEHKHVLEKQVNIRTQTLREQNKDLQNARLLAEQANRAKSDFVANMSHEIRTPMHAIIGMIHLALQTDLNDKQQDYLTKVNTAAHSLLGIINDILDFSKIEAGKMKMETVVFNLQDVLNNLATVTSAKAQKKGLQINVKLDSEVPKILLGDSLRLGQVLLNLTNNAIKFTQHGVININIKVITELSQQPENDMMLEFSVADTGIGLSKEQTDRLFRPFTQADASTTRKYGGTGLGLTICKQLVQLMGGKIWVESESGKGCRFIFTAGFGFQEEVGFQNDSDLQEQTDAVKISECSSEGVQAIAGARILVVEDSSINQQIAREILQQAGFVVTLANNGKEGVQKVHENCFDAVLMDLQMPEMDGFEATKIIRQDARFANLPIIAMTAHAMVEEKDKCLAVGMNDHTAKPIDLPHLFGLLCRWIKPGMHDQVESGVEQEAVKSLPTTLPGIELADLLEKIGGNQQLLYNLFDMFRQEYADTAIQIRALLDQGDRHSAKQLVHKINGTSANLSAMALYNVASQLDEALRQEHSDNLPALLDQFELQLKEVVVSIATFTADMNQNIPASKHSPDSSET